MFAVRELLRMSTECMVRASARHCRTPSSAQTKICCPRRQNSAIEIFLIAVCAIELLREGSINLRVYLVQVSSLQNWSE